MRRLALSAVKVKQVIPMYPYGKNRGGKSWLHIFSEGKLPLGGRLNER